MRFHLAVAFLDTSQLLDIARASDATGYAGIYVSDHLFHPRRLQSRYTYSPHADGSPIWPPDTDWPDPWCLISAMAGTTAMLHFTTGVYIAPARDLVTVAKLVGTAAVLSGGRVRLGVGAGWCKEEFDATGQRFEDRGRRLDDMIPALRALWRGGWVEYHGTHYDVPEMQMNPSPAVPVPIYGGGHSAPAVRRAVELCDGWLGASAYAPDEAWARLAEVTGALERTGRSDQPFDIYLAVRAAPDLDLYRRLEDAGVTDLICAPWMGAREPTLAARVAATEDFAEQVIARM